jgi:hypothetical protein
MVTTESPIEPPIQLVSSAKLFIAKSAVLATFDNSIGRVDVYIYNVNNTLVAKDASCCAGAKAAIFDSQVGTTYVKKPKLYI